MTAIINITGSFRKFFVIASLALALGFSSTGFARADGVKPNLIIVSAGISNYQDLNKLKVAHKDAQDIATLFQGQQGKMFGTVQANLLTDAQVTVANLQKAIMQAKAQATADSYLIVYLAGHGGKGKNAEYAYCAYDHDFTWTQIQTALRGTPGKVIVILDTCEAGSVTPNDNMVVFCGSLASEGGQEDQFDRGNGYFTKVLVEALKGRADANGDGTVTLEEVGNYVAARLNQISNGTQHSLLLQPSTVNGSLPLTQLTPAIPGNAVVQQEPNFGGIHAYAGN